MVALKTTMQAINEVVGDTEGSTQATQVRQMGLNTVLLWPAAPQLCDQHARCFEGQCTNSQPLDVSTVCQNCIDAVCCRQGAALVQAHCACFALHTPCTTAPCLHPSQSSLQEHGTILPMLIAAKTAQPAALTPLAIILEGLEQLEKLTAANLKAGVFQGV